MRCRLLLSQRKILRISRGDSRMNSTRVLVTMALLTLGLSIFALARVALPPQAVLEETISGTIAATRTITQNARLTGDVTCTVEAAPCIQFGAPGLTLNLAGFTITGQGDPSTGCSSQATPAENGILVSNQADETIQGSGLVQRFRANGILLLNSTRNLVTRVTASTNCQSGIQANGSSDNHIEW